MNIFYSFLFNLFNQMDFLNMTLNGAILFCLEAKNFSYLTKLRNHILYLFPC